MVTDPRFQALSPGVHMNMVNLDTPFPQRRRNEHLVESLRVLVEDVTVPLILWDISGDVNVGKVGVERSVNRACLVELVEVTSNDDIGLRVFREDSLDEAL